MQTNNLTLTFQYTQKEYVQAYRDYLIASKKIRQMDFILFPVLLTGAVIYAVFTQFGIFSVFLLITFVLATAIGVFFYGYTPVYIFRQTEKLHSEYTLELSGQALHFRTTGIDSQLGWEVYSQIWESSHSYYLMQKAQAYTLIPKRAFLDDRQEQQFRAIITNTVGAVKHV